MRKIEVSNAWMKKLMIKVLNAIYQLHLPLFLLDKNTAVSFYLITSNQKSAHEMNHMQTNA